MVKGSHLAVQTAKNAILQILEEIIKEGGEEALKNSTDCSICWGELKEGYRLQLCEHRFCTACISKSIVTVFGDKTQFPIGCPQCMKKISLIDL
jgi:hypothetical protein